MNKRRILLALSVVLTAGRALHGADRAAPASPAFERAREIYVPFEDLKLLLAEQPGRVLLTRAEYETLLQSARPKPESHAPVEVAAVSADYAVTVGLERAEISGTITLEAVEDGFHAVDLNIAQVGLRRAVLDGRGAPLAKIAGQGLTLFVEGKGRHELALDMVAPVETTAAVQSLTFVLPTPPITRMRLVALGNVELRSGAAVLSRVFDESSQSTRFELLPQPAVGVVRNDEKANVSRYEPVQNSGTVTLVMSLNNRMLQSRRAVVARGVVVDEVTTSYERLHATYSMSILHQATDRFRFAIPPPFEVTEVKSPLLSQWSAATEGERTILDVRLREPTKETVRISFSAMSTAGDRAHWSLPRLSPLEVVGQAAVAAILLEDRLVPRTLFSSTMIPIDANVLREALSASAAEAEPGAPRLRAVAAYYAPNGSETFDVTGTFEQPPGRLRVTTNLLLSLEDQGLRLHGGFALKPEAEKLFAVEISVPRGWHVIEVSDAAGVKLPFELLPPADPSASSRLHVARPGGVAPGEEMTLYLQAAHAPDGWLSDWDSTVVAFPAFFVTGAARDVGAIAARGGADLHVFPQSVEGLTPLDDKDKTQYGFSAVNLPREAPAFRYDKPGYQAAFRVERAAPRTTARSYSFFHVRPDSLTAHYELAYEVERARTAKLVFSLPANVPSDVTITGLEGVVVKEHEAALIGGRRRWTVRLAEARSGTARLSVEFEQGINTREALAMELPIVRAEAAVYQSGLAAVEGDADLDVQLVEHPRKVDVGELAAAAYRPAHGVVGGLGVFAFIGDDPALSVRVSRPAPYALPTAVVQRAEMVTQLSAGGFSQTATRLLLRTTSAYLEAELPSKGELWSVELDGKPVQPQREGGRLLIGVPGSDRLVDLRIVHEAPIAAVSFRGEVEVTPVRLAMRAEGAERTNVEVPIADLDWHVHLPVGFRMSDHGGTVTTAWRLDPEPAAWTLVKWLPQLAGGVNLFYGGCLPTLSRARELSHRSAAPQGIFGEVNGELVGDERAKEAKSTQTPSLEPKAERPKKSMPKPKMKPSEANETAKAEPPPPPAPFAGAASPPPRAQRDYWALEGVRSLKIPLERSGETVAFQSLGVDPRISLTLTNEDRMDALRWGLALAAGLVGISLTSRGTRVKTLYIVAVAFAATLIPLALASPEMILVMNPTFHAAALLVVYYLLAALVGRVRVRMNRPLRMPAGAALVVLLMISSVVGAEPPAAKGTPEDPIVVRITEPHGTVKIPDDAVVVPYDPAKVPSPHGSAKSGEQVLIPYARFQTLWNLAHPEAFPTIAAPPTPYALSGGSFKAVLQGDDYLTLEGSLDVSVFTDDYVTIPLLLADGVLVRAELDGQPARLTGRPAENETKPADAAVAAPFTLQVQGRGAHRLDLTVRLKLSRQGGWRITEGRVPAAPGTALTLVVPDVGTEVRLDGVCDGRNHETKNADETISTALGSDGLVNVRWRPRIHAALSDSSLTVASEALLDVREDGLLAIWRLSLTAGHTERDSFRLSVPRDFPIQKIDGPNVRGWQSRAVDEQEIEVTLLQPTSGAETVTVVLHQRRSFTNMPPWKLEVPIVRVVGAALQNGQVTIRKSSLLDLSTESTVGVTRVDAPKEAESLAALAPTGADSPLGMRVYQSYRFASSSFDVRLVASPIEPEWSAELETILRWGERRRTLETRIHILAEKQPVHQVRVALPADLTLEQVQAPSAFEWAVTDEAGKTLVVQWPDGLRNRFAIILQGVLGEDGAVETMELPIFHVLGASHQRGEAAIQIDPAFDLWVNPVKNCREIPLSDVNHWLAAPQRSLTRVALSHSGDGYRALLRVTPRQPDVTCTTITNVRLTESTVEETVLLDFVVAQAGIRTVTFVLPHRMRDSRIVVPMLREKTITPILDEPDAPVRIKLALQDEVMGRLRVLVENDRLLSDEAYPVPVPIVETGVSDRRYVALESAGRDEMVIESQLGFEALTHLQKEWKTLSNVVGSDLTQAYVATGEKPALTLKTRERAAVETTGARIGLATTVLVMDAHGAYRATQSYRVDNRTEPFLEVELPAGASLWSVLVADQPVKPAQASVASTDRRVRIPLVKTAAGDLDYEVILKYGGKTAPPGALRQVDFPLPRSVNIPVELSQVNLWLPEGYRWFDFDGTMRRVVDEAEVAAGYVRYQTRMTERLGQALQSESPFARARAGKSLENLQSQSIQIQQSASTRSGSAALQQELVANTMANEQAQRQLQQQRDQQQVQLGLARSNRERLSESFETQQIVRARNLVQDMPDNFNQTLPVGADDRREEKAFFDLAWLDRNQLGEQEERQGRKAGRALQKTQRDRKDQPQQQPGVHQPASARLSQKPPEGLTFEFEERPAPMAQDKPRRGQTADELAVQYQQQLSKDDRGGAGGTPAAQTIQGGQWMFGADALGLASLTVDFPLRGVAYHFTTPRGEISITARTISRRFVDDLVRVGLVLLAGAIFAVLYRVGNRLAVTKVIGSTGATLLVLLGAAGLLTGVLPIVGFALSITGIALKKRLRREREAMMIPA